RRRNRLPLHIGWAVTPAPLKWNDMVHDVAGTSVSVAGFSHELPLLSFTPYQSAVAISSSRSGHSIVRRRTGRRVGAVGTGVMCRPAPRTQISAPGVATVAPAATPACVALGRRRQQQYRGAESDETFH